MISGIASSAIPSYNRVHARVSIHPVTGWRRFISNTLVPLVSTPTLHKYLASSNPAVQTNWQPAFIDVFNLSPLSLGDFYADGFRMVLGRDQTGCRAAMIRRGCMYRYASRTIIWIRFHIRVALINNNIHPFDKSCHIAGIYTPGFAYVLSCLVTTRSSQYHNRLNIMILTKR